jgi:hypothetical protein
VEAGSIAASPFRTFRLFKKSLQHFQKAGHRLSGCPIVFCCGLFRTKT